MGTETFETIPVATTSPIGISFSGTVGSITATISGPGTTVLGSPRSGRFATSGSLYVAGNAGGGFQIGFSAPISAFGFYATDIGDFGGQLSLIMTPSGGGPNVVLQPAHSLGSGGSTNGRPLFFGFYDTTTSYSSILFGNSSTGDVFGFDDMTIGDRDQVTPDPSGVIPLPVPILLLGSGIMLLGGLGFARRRAS